MASSLPHAFQVLLILGEGKAGKLDPGKPSSLTQAELQLPPFPCVIHGTGAVRGSRGDVKDDHPSHPTDTARCPQTAPPLLCLPPAYATTIGTLELPQPISIKLESYTNSYLSSAWVILSGKHVRSSMPAGNVFIRTAWPLVSWLSKPSSTSPYTKLPHV